MQDHYGRHRNQLQTDSSHREQWIPPRPSQRVCLGLLHCCPSLLAREPGPWARPLSELSTTRVAGSAVIHRPSWKSVERLLYLPWAMVVAFAATLRFSLAVLRYVICHRPWTTASPSPSAGRSLMHVQMYLLLHSAQPGSYVAVHTPRKAL